MLRPLAELFVRLGLETSQFDKGLAASKNQLTSTASQLKALAGELGLAFSSGALLKWSVGAASGAQQFVSQMQGVMGSMEEAIRLEDRMSEFEMAKGLEESVEPAIKALARAGMSVDEIGTRLEQVSDIAAETGGSVSGIANAMIRMNQRSMEAGTIEMMFRRAGVQLGSVAKAAGISEEKFKEMVKSKKLGAAEVMAIFEKLTGAGGKWSQSSERMAQTWSAVWRRFKATIGEVGESIGTSLLEPLTNAVLAMRGAVGMVLNFDKATGGLIGKLAAGALIVLQFQTGLAIFNRIMGTSLGPLGAVVKLLGLFGKSIIPLTKLSLVSAVIWGVVSAVQAFASWLAKSDAWQKAWAIASNNFAKAWVNIKAGASAAWDLLKRFGAWLLLNNPLSIVARWAGVGGDDIASFASNFVLKISEAVKVAAKTFRFLGESWDTILLMMGAKYDAFMEKIAMGAASAVGADALAKTHKETMEAFLATAENYRKLLASKWANLDKELKLPEAEKAAKKPAAAMAREISKLKVSMMSLDDYWLAMMGDMEDSSVKSAAKSSDAWARERRKKVEADRAAGHEKGEWLWAGMTPEERAATRNITPAVWDPERFGGLGRNRRLDLEFEARHARPGPGKYDIMDEAGFVAAFEAVGLDIRTMRETRTDYLTAAKMMLEAARKGLPLGIADK